MVRQALGSVAGAFGLLEVDQIVFFILGDVETMFSIYRKIGYDDWIVRQSRELDADRFAAGSGRCASGRGASPN